MPTCDHCGIEFGRLPFECNRCGRQHCSDCRLPENHLCDSLYTAEGEAVGLSDVATKITNPITRSGERKAEARKHHSGPDLAPDGSLIGAKGTSAAQRARSNSEPSGSAKLAILAKSQLMLLAVVVVLFGGFFVAASAGTFSGVDLPEAGNTSILDGDGDETDTPDREPITISLSNISLDDDPPDTTPDPTPNPNPSISAREVETLVAERINEYRENRSLQRLESDEDVAAVAREYSAALADADELTHNLDGTTPQDRMDVAGVECRTGENIAQTWVNTRIDTGDGTAFHRSAEDLAQGLFEQWRTSPGHHQNMINDYSRHGIGIHIEGSRKVWATHNFCL